MKALLYLLIVACTTILWNSNVLSQSLPPISKSSVNTSAECDPPNHWMGFFDPSVASSPNPIIFSEQIKEELMSDGFQGKDKEYGDIDNDGDVDILYTKNGNQLWLLRNSGNPTNPEFLLNHAVNTGLIGVYSFKFLDWFADSIQDLLVLEQFNSDPPIVSLYININSQIGFPAPAAVLINGTTVPLNSNNFIEVGTINDDPYPDILISGTVGIHGTALFTSSFNSGWNLPVAPPFRIEPPQTFATPMIPDNSGSAPCPELFDADCDDDLDLFISDPIWAGGGGHVDFYRLIDKASPQLSYTHINPNPYGFDDILSPNTALTCDWVITRFADFFGDGKAEAIAYNPCSNNHPKGDMIYYKNTFQCEADFSFSSIDGCQVFQFTDLSSSTNAITYSWNFGDPQSGNNTSVVQNPNHYFTACGTYTVCLTISGNACNLTVCHVVPVLDIIPPVASCVSGTGIVLDANCIAVTSPNIFDNGSTDNCQIFSMSISQDTFTQCGNFPIILTVTDWCGNTAACVSNVQVFESIPPIIRCHPNLTISSTSNSCTKVVNGIKWTILSDNCSSPTVTYTVTGATTHAGVNDASGITFNTGVSIVTYKATDACGNTS
ncbi:MAG: PKD domain-containing protein, partial [Saprospiraceae bacterium]